MIPAKNVPLPLLSRAITPSETCRTARRKERTSKKIREKRRKMTKEVARKREHKRKEPDENRSGFPLLL